LIDGMRAAGLAVTTDIVGEPGPLDPSVDLAAYRVVQEALTNAAKHAGPGAATTVRFTWEPGALLLEVRDDGGGRSRDPRALSTGHGLLGLAERVAVADGQFRAAPLQGGGFEVAARLPRARPDPSPDAADGTPAAPGAGAAAERTSARR
jgi:signal transduction histidine kinase